MVHLSVAVGRFFEALLWALARGIGMVALALVGGVLGIAVIAAAARATQRRSRFRDGRHRARSAELHPETRDEQA